MKGEKIVMFLLTVIMITGQQDRKIKICSDFRYCSHSYNDKILNINNICDSHKINTEKPRVENNLIQEHLTMHLDHIPISEKEKKLFSMFGRTKYLVYGTAYHCLMNKHVLKTSVSIFGERSEILRIEPIRLNREECLTMIKTKKCNNYEMESDGDNHSFSIHPNFYPEYKWLQELVYTNYSCAFSPKSIAAVNLNDTIFGPNCKAFDLFCPLHDSIIVWTKTDIHECGLYYIGQIWLNVKRNFPNFLFSENRTLVLEILEQVAICDEIFLKTGQGIYITNVRWYKKKFAIYPESSITEGFENLLLAENDKRYLDNLKDRRVIIYEECLNFQRILNLFSKIENEYLTHTLGDGSTATFYTRLGVIYKADCIAVKTILFLTDTRDPKNPNMCFVDQPIIFYNPLKNNSKTTGFLTHDGIIKQISELTQCKNLVQYIDIPFSNKSIIRNGFLSKVALDNEIQYYDFNYFENKISQFNIMHNPILLDGIDVVSTFHDLNRHETPFGVWYTHNLDEHEEKVKLLDTKQQLQDEFNRFLFNYKIEISILLSILFFVFLLIIRYILIKICA